MSFFKTSDGQDIEQSTSCDVGGIQPLIPSGTKLHCMVAGAEWKENTFDGNEIVDIELHVVEKGPYKDFVVHDKCKVFDNEPKKADKALNKLMVYDTNAKSMLLAADKSGKSFIGDSTFLARALNGASVIATFDVWEMEGSDGVTRSGNWVRAIQSAKGNGISANPPQVSKEEEKAVEIKAEVNQPTSTYIPEEEFDDTQIPF